MDTNQDQARDAVRQAMARKQIDRTALARLAGVDAATAGDFLSGQRWPRTTTLAKLDTALGWSPGTLSSVAAGEDPPDLNDVGGAGQGGGMLINVDPESYGDLNQAELAEAIATATAVFLRAVREIRGQRGDD